MGKEPLLLVGWIEKWALGLTACFSLAGWVVGGVAVGASVAVGGLLATLNFRWLQFFTFRVVLTADRRLMKTLTHLSVAVRYIALAVVLWLLIKSPRVDLVGLLVGLSVVTLAVVVAGLLHSLRSSRSVDLAG